jgi:DNA invertase Pin-like site-specific DNA recombinase
MVTGTFVAYYRVSTKKQGVSGLGLEAQKHAVQRYLDGGKWSLLAEFTEIESGKKHENRPQLLEALRECRMTGAKLIVSRLDRLSRDLEFIAHLQKSSVKFVVADMPYANHLNIQIMAAMAQHERELIRQRTKDALAVAKVRKQAGSRRGITAGIQNFRKHGDEGRQRAVASIKHKADEFAQLLAPLLQRYVDQKLSQAQMAKALNRRGVLTPRGKTGTWTQGRVSRVLSRLAKGAKATGTV